MSAATTIDHALRDFRRLDLLAAGDSWVHRLDARAKVLAVAGYVLAVVSCNRYALTELLPFAVFPAFVVLAARLPADLVLRRSALVLPFALAVGALNPLFDRGILIEAGPLAINGGFVSWASIVLRALLAASGAVVLVGTTGFAQIAAALGRLGMPRALVVQLSFLYRYLQLLGDETRRVLGARELRACGRRLEMAELGPLVGQLLLRTWQRAERIYMAMLARGFNGRFPLSGTARFGTREAGFVAGWFVVFLLLRVSSLTRDLGAALLGVLG